MASLFTPLMFAGLHNHSPLLTMVWRNLPQNQFSAYYQYMYIYFASISYIYLLLTEFEVCIVPTEKTILVRYLLYLLCVWRVRERFLSLRNGFKFLKQVESKRSQFEIVFMSLARFTTQFKVKESFKLLFARKLRKLGDKSRHSLATETTLNFSGPCRSLCTAR